jgi:LysM repeat protein/soluble lytic murein transglycosylase-like protein
MRPSFLFPIQVHTDIKFAEIDRVLPRPMIMRLAPHALVVAIATIMAGCSSTPVQTNNHKIHGKKVSSSLKGKVNQDDLDFESADSMEELLQATDMEAVEGNRLAVLRYGNLWKRITVGFRMDLDVENSRINSQRNWFVSRQPYMDRLSARASRYIYYTVTEAERRGIPTELALLPVIESSYDPFASSNASAAGMWQFIPSTGRIYGLRQDQYYDGRRDVVESTRAAYDFLTALYQQFGSWELALAAYNAGGGRIQQAINRNIAQGLPTDYWSLKLPQETMNYVPRFIAVAQIIKDPEKYGVQLPKIANRPHFRSVAMSGPVDLDQVARTTGLSSKEVLELNPAFLQGVTAPAAPFRILIPNTLSFAVDSKLKSLPIIAPSRFGFSAEGDAYLAMNTQPITQSITQTITRSDGSVSTNTTSRAASIMNSSVSSKYAGSGSNNGNVTQSVTMSNNQIPSDPNALAAMANRATVPSKSRIANAVSNIDSGANSAVSSVRNTNQALAQPSISNAAATTINITTHPTKALSTTVNPNVSVDKASIGPATLSPIVAVPSKTIDIVPALAMSIDQKNSNTTKATPVLTPSEKSSVVSEIKSIAPVNTVVTDPLDGKIPLTAIQTQQTVLDKKGQTKELSYEQPYLKSPTTLDIKNHKLLPAETKIVAEVKEPSKPKGIRTIYTVKPGDTLNSVASKSGLNWREIAKWNQMDANAALMTGTPLYLYGAKKIVVEAPTSYVVQAGDTLTDVAAQFNLSPRQLADRNDLKVTSYLIKGSRLNLVENNDSPSSKSKEVSNKSVDNSSNSTSMPTEDYKIKSGDSLGKIASRYNLSVSDLAKLNNVPANLELRSGDTISVPVAEKSSKRGDSKITEQVSVSAEDKIATADYIVKRGETLGRIAAEHGLTVVALADLNRIPSTTRIQTGDTISVPEVEKAAKKKSHRRS